MHAAVATGEHGIAVPRPDLHAAIDAAVLLGDSGRGSRRFGFNQDVLELRRCGRRGRTRGSGMVGSVAAISPDEKDSFEELEQAKS